MKFFLITIDVEDWFQVENFKSWIPFSTWEERELRVERNVHRLLDLFDSIALPVPKISPSVSLNPGIFKTNTSNSTPKTTFFVLAWIAERLPHLVRTIADRGHEVASHGYNHERPNKMPSASFYTELTDSRKKLEDTIGSSVVGFRAPSFAIDDGILRAVSMSGYFYDSSYNSFSFHGRYGKISLNGQIQAGIAHQIVGNFYELPISNLKFLGRVLPLGGGAYFRLFPFRFFKLGVKQILKSEDAYLFYIHPWELDPEQPRVTKASLGKRIRHYSMLSKTFGRLDRIINAFKYCRFTTCSQYLKAKGTNLALSRMGRV